MREDPFFCFQYSKDLELEIWKDCVFVLDTSALLELYFYSSSSQEKIFDKVFRPLKNRVWVPNHVEFEYLKNRKGSIKKPISEKYKPIQNEGLDEIRSQIKSLRSKVVDLKQKTQKKETHPYLDQTIFEKLLQSIDSVNGEFDDFSKKALQQIDERKSEIEAQEEDDNVFKNLKELVPVGDGYSFARKMEVLAESELRFRNKIPPGYKDADGKGQKDGFQKIGDLLIWKQIIDRAEVTQKPIVFVTNDVKEDWCYATKRSNEVRIERPREELIQEIFSAAKVKFWMYNFPQFLYACKEILGISIDDNVLEEAEDAARERFDTSSKLRFDGVYVLPSDSGDYAYHLRFFDDGTVISVSMVGSISSETLKWFDRNYQENRGKYTLSDNSIVFSVTSNAGTIDHSGTVGNDLLNLSSHSHINGFKMSERIYRFVSFGSISTG